jgi:hypothetical protein
MEGSSKKRQHVQCEPGNSDDGGIGRDIEMSLKKRRVGNGFSDELSWISQEQQQQQQEGEVAQQQQLLGGYQDRLPSVDMDSVVDNQDLMTGISEEEGNGAKESTEKKSTHGDWGMMEDDETKSLHSEMIKDGAAKRGILEAASGAKKIRVHLPEGYHSSKYGVDASSYGRTDMAMLNGMEGGRACSDAVISRELKADNDETSGLHSMALVPYAPLPIHALVHHMASTEADEARSEQQSGSMEMEQ